MRLLKHLSLVKKYIDTKRQKKVELKPGRLVISLIPRFLCVGLGMRLFCRDKIFVCPESLGGRLSDHTFLFTFYPSSILSLRLPVSIESYTLGTVSLGLSVLP